MTDKLDLNPPRGMHDFAPRDWVFRKKLMAAFAEVSEARGFLRYETPVVDSYELFERKAGEEISDQIYDFADKSGRRLALRPELTPAMVRLYSAEKESLPATAKLYSIGQCFRYERATKGRKREHFQWNVDILGEPSIAAEAWLLFTAVGVMNKLGLDSGDFKIRLSNRALLSEFLAKTGIKEELFSELMILIDKKDKVEAAWLAEEMAKLGLSQAQVEKVTEFINTADLAKIESLVGAGSENLNQIKDLLNKCRALGIEDYIQIDPSIIRGLSYYTGIVFEAFDTKREFRAIFGGGRYDKLFTKMVEKDIPACGLGFGDVVIEELCAAKFGRAETFAGIDTLVGYFDDSLQPQALAMAAKLAEQGRAVDMALSAQNPKKFFTGANKRGAQFTAYLAPEEASNGEYVLKNMLTGEQTTEKL